VEIAVEIRITFQVRLLVDSAILAPVTSEILYIV